MGASFWARLTPEPASFEWPAVPAETETLSLPPVPAAVITSMRSRCMSLRSA